MGGNDTLSGGGGRDTLAGGMGADTSLYNHARDTLSSQRDAIVDFQAGVDILDLSDLDANNNPSDGNQAFTLVSIFSGQRGKAMVMYDAETNMTSVKLDVNLASPGRRHG